MATANFIEELQLAADRSAEMSGADLRALIRRAALLLRNARGGDVNLEADVEVALEGVAAERRVSKPQLLRLIVRQWLIVNSDLPLYKMDEEA
ncbi:hypothetical protein DPM33_13550 [Mesorhizobium hawassense]|uniref:CopG family transcriptional regulator n=1 Tax=Mesorhizobium hawassense TaxID=1209954 RepID=A0A330HRY7_9HYPH|nr:hypothetical protein [Mesorhizobium hawassense]RAZ90528.1 hypothetical protein DPM33_13550 [Mesorhizobium hawassense]